MPWTVVSVLVWVFQSQMKVSCPSHRWSQTRAAVGWWSVGMQLCPSWAGLWSLEVWPSCYSRCRATRSTAATGQRGAAAVQPDWPGSCRRPLPSWCRCCCCCSPSQDQALGQGGLCCSVPSCYTISTGQHPYDPSPSEGHSCLSARFIYSSMLI